MKAKLFVASCLLAFCSSCSTYSLVELNTKSKLPEYVTNHHSGIIAKPTKIEVERAVKLGVSSKDDGRLQYAYLHKEPLSSLEHSTIYVQVKTPLYLIAEEAREAARNFDRPDEKFVDYCSELDVAAIDVRGQYLTKGMEQLSFKQDLILLHNGVKVPPLTKIHSYQGENPFQKFSDPVTQALNIARSSMIKPTLTKDSLQA